MPPLVVLVPPGDDFVAEIVSAAMIRSFSAAQVAVRPYGDIDPSIRAAVLVDPPDEAAATLRHLLSSGGKALVLGRVAPAIADVLELTAAGPPQLPEEAFTAVPDHRVHHNASPAQVVYSRHSLARTSPLTSRPFCRFDYQDEWNNFGFGRITARGPWALATQCDAAGGEVIAHVTLSTGGPMGVYAALTEWPRGAALWFNRSVGPVDSHEWHIVERFFSSYRADELVALPCVAEIPAGYDAAATVRIDCDEALASGRHLFELYRDASVPFSLAVRTGLEFRDADRRLMSDVLHARGSVVSHSVDHLPAWGGSYVAALSQAAESKQWIQRHVPGAAPVEHAVSPFHQNPRAAVEALRAAGYRGFVAGSVACDPEFLLGRGGRVPFCRELVSHSQQCMLHGECFARYGHTTDVYERSFDQHRAAGSIFGYLDHPFSERYAYGWASEEVRLEAHRRLLAHISGSGHVWWPNTSEVLRFMRKRDRARVMVEGGRLVVDGGAADDLPPLAVEWRGKSYAC